MRRLVFDSYQRCPKHFEIKFKTSSEIHIPNNVAFSLKYGVSYFHSRITVVNSKVFSTLVNSRRRNQFGRSLMLMAKLLIPLTEQLPDGTELGATSITDTTSLRTCVKHWWIEINKSHFPKLSLKLLDIINIKIIVSIKTYSNEQWRDVYIIKQGCSFFQYSLATSMTN